jgi:hypothetical protein
MSLDQERIMARTLSQKLAVRDGFDEISGGICSKNPAGTV